MQKNPRGRVWQAVSFAWEAGFLVVLALGIPLAGGILLDARLNSTPLFLLAGVLAGIVLATVLLLRKAGRIISED